MSERSESNGAGGGSRTRVASLENWNNGRYTTPAIANAIAEKPARYAQLGQLYLILS